MIARPGVSETDAPTSVCIGFLCCLALSVKIDIFEIITCGIMEEVWCRDTSILLNPALLLLSDVVRSAEGGSVHWM